MRFHPTRHVRAHLVVAGAVGVPQGFYRRFAKRAQAHGYSTTTFDYRGIGESAPPSLRGFRMDFRDWGRLDLAAVVHDAHARAERDGRPVLLVAHSFGGHAFALLPHPERVRACFMFGTGAGWHGWMPRSERWRVRLLWNVAGPLLTRWKGYLPWRMIGMGEDLPYDVYRQWKSWVRHPHFFFDDPALGGELREAVARIRVPIAAASAGDDRWSTHDSCDAILSTFVNTSIHRVRLDPSQLGVGPIGHMGFFRARAEPLWNDVFAWLDAQSDACSDECSDE